MTDDKRIENFIDSVCTQIHTEDEALDIKLELNDHIECLIEDYTDQGYDEDSSVKKSLLQMGDPKEIGYSFTNFDLMKRRNMFLRIFKSISFLLVLLATVAYILPFTRADMTIRDIEMSFTSILLISTYAFVFYSLFSVRILSRKSKFTDLSTSPLLIIWPVKRKIRWEYCIALFMFSPVILLFITALFSGVLEIGSLFEIALVFSSSLLAVFFFFFAEKFRIPKYILLEEGLVISNSFLSWTAINSIRWNNDYNKNEKTYSLSLFGVSRQNGIKAKVARDINVSKRQVNMINNIIRRKI